MFDEGRQTQNRVVPPIRTAITLPARRAQRVGAHAEPHAELKNAREGAGTRQAGHQRLQNADARLGLHDAHQAQHRRRRHHAVGIEHDGVFMLPPPLLAKIADIARLEAAAVLAPAIGNL